jgi:hypothetical protein
MRLPTPVEVAAETLNRYVGRYRLPDGAVYDFTVQEGVLLAQITGQPTHPVFPKSQTRFSYRGVAAEIEFLMEDGRATSLVLYQSGREIAATRIENQAAGIDLVPKGGGSPTRN